MGSAGLQNIHGRKCRPRVTGNLGYDPDNSLFLLDESLAPAVAQALRLVGYNIADVETAFDHIGIIGPPPRTRRHPLFPARENLNVLP